jgi:DNA-binding transcriptional MerR regulator
MILEDITVEDEIEAAFEEGREDANENILNLINQGFSLDEIKKHLQSLSTKK